MRNIVLIFTIAIVSAYFGLYVLPACEADPANPCYNLHKEIVSHTAAAPYRYRILTPLIIQAMGAVDDGHFLTSYFVFQVIQFALFFVGLYKWLRTWANEQGALMGVAVAALAFPLMDRFYWYAPYTSFEATLIVWSLVCLAYMRCSSLLQV